MYIISLCNLHFILLNFFSIPRSLLSSILSIYLLILFPRITHNANEGDVSKYYERLQNYNISMQLGTAEKGLALRSWIRRNVNNIYPP